MDLENLLQKDGKSKYLDSSWKLKVEVKNGVARAQIYLVTNALEGLFSVSPNSNELYKCGDYICFCLGCALSRVLEGGGNSALVDFFHWVAELATKLA